MKISTNQSLVNIFMVAPESQGFCLLLHRLHEFSSHWSVSDELKCISLVRGMFFGKPQQDWLEKLDKNKREAAPWYMCESSTSAA